MSESDAAVVLVHGRGLQMPRELRDDRTRVTAHVETLKRAWLAGLARGLTAAGMQPLHPENTYFPYYGNAFADAIHRYATSGGEPPELDTAPGFGMRDQLIVEAADQLGFRPSRELARTDPELAERLGECGSILDLGLSDLLRIPLVTSALQFLARKTGLPEWIIEEFLTDVAYYFEVPEIRSRVLDIVASDVERARRRHDEVVLVSHSLGTVAAYDLFAELPADLPVRRLVTAGSPLGFPVVRGNLHNPSATGGPLPVPRAGNGPVPWLNAYDVCDIVALIHPLDGLFDGPITDERTSNPSDAHAVTGYLSDPDVAEPIGRAVRGTGRPEPALRARTPV